MSLDLITNTKADQLRQKLSEAAKREQQQLLEMQQLKDQAKVNLQ